MKENGILLLGDYVIIPILLVITLLVFIIVFIYKKNYILSGIFVGLLLLFYAVTCIFPIPMTWIYKDYNEEFDKNDIFIKGTWTTVYKPRNGKIVKQISAPGVSHQNFKHVCLPTPYRMCTRNSCTLVTMTAHRISTRFMLLSLHRIKEMDSKFIAKIYEINDEKRRYIQEYVPHELNKDSCPVNYEEQLKEFNQELKKHGYYIDDIHSKNWMVDDNGQLKIIDGELYTESELEIQQGLLNIIDGSQKGIAKGHIVAPRILHWQDGRPKIKDICK